MGKGYNCSYEIHFWPQETFTMVFFAKVRDEKIHLHRKTLRFFLGGWGGGENFYIIQPLAIKDTYSLLIFSTLIHDPEGVGK